MCSSLILRRLARWPNNDVSSTGKSKGNHHVKMILHNALCPAGVLIKLFCFVV